MKCPGCGDDLERYGRLLEVGRIITSEMNFDVLFPLVIEHTNSIMGTEASSLFLFEEETEELRSLTSTNLEGSNIRIPATQGIAGWVFQHGTHAVVNDTSSDPRFSRATDAKTGFHTRNLLCVPLVARQKASIGTLQALNKREGAFTADDVEVLTSLSNYATVALENSRLYEELKAMNKAKSRAISHLSHELKTPLSLIAAAISAVSKKPGTAGLEGNLAIAERNIHRLLRLRKEIDDIMREEGHDYQAMISRLLEDAFHVVEYQRGVVSGSYRDALDLVTDYIDSLYRTEPASVERISARTFLHALCEAARSASTDREVEIVEDLTDVAVTGNRIALATVFEGILRNAIENTPDEGRIEVTTRHDATHLLVEIRDFGTGITPENQKVIFTGFFHAQETDHYSTKTPYAFNAGGSGADLLRAKVFAERYGFGIGFASARCPFLPEDRDECPGRISLCTHDRPVCAGTTFSVTIPMDRHKTTGSAQP